MINSRVQLPVIKDETKVDAGVYELIDRGYSIFGLSAEGLVVYRMEKLTQIWNGSRSVWVRGNQVPDDAKIIGTLASVVLELTDKGASVLGSIKLMESLPVSDESKRPRL